MRLRRFTSRVSGIAKHLFSLNLKNTSPHVRCGYECDAWCVFFKNAAGDGHPSPFVRLNILFGDFDTLNDWQICLWRGCQMSARSLSLRDTGVSGLIAEANSLIISEECIISGNFFLRGSGYFANFASQSGRGAVAFAKLGVAGKRDKCFSPGRWSFLRNHELTGIFSRLTYTI